MSRLDTCVVRFPECTLWEPSGRDLTDHQSRGPRGAALQMFGILPIA